MSNFDLTTREILRGKGGVEDFAEMYKRYPLANEYWSDKRADMTQIQCPYLWLRLLFHSHHGSYARLDGTTVQKQVDPVELLPRMV
jgi:hypothetical protein